MNAAVDMNRSKALSGPSISAADAVLLCVDPAKIDEIWPHVSSLLAKAFENTRADSTLESIEATLRRGLTLLWIVWASEQIVAAATTELWVTPARKACVITCCAGAELETWKGFMADFERYARDEGCDVIRIFGRPDWKCIFLDFYEPWLTLEKALI